MEDELRAQRDVPAEVRGPQDELQGTGASRVWPAVVAVLVMIGAVVALVVFWPEPPDAAGGKGGKGGKETPAVQTTAVVRQDLALRAHYRGELDADAVDVGPDIGGRLIELRVRLGDAVEAGEVLAKLDGDTWKRQLDEAAAQLRVSQAAVRRSATQLEAAQREQGRQQQLVDDQLISVNQADALGAKVGGLQADKDQAAAQVDQARARMALLREHLKDTTLVAPFKGRVVDRLAAPGAYLQPGAGVVRLVSTDDVRVRFEVPEQDILRVAPGAAFEVRVPSDASTVGGKVVGIGSEVDRNLRVIRVEGRLDRQPDGWLPGMYVEVVLDLATLKAATVVPTSALLARPDPSGAEVQGVFRLEGKLARWVPVEVLGRQGDLVALSDEVKPGDSVMTAGHHGLKDGSTVDVVGGDGVEVKP